MRVAKISLVVVIALTGIAMFSTAVTAQSRPAETARPRIVVFAHDDSASLALARAIHLQLAKDREVEVLGNVLAPIDRNPTPGAGDWTLEEKRDQARNLKADAFVDIDAKRVADISSVTAALGFTGPFIVDNFKEVKQGSLELVAQSVVQKLGRSRWRSDRL
jgi:hypothetical protein